MKRPNPLERSREAKRQAVVILEVLAGVRSAPEGAEALGISLTRYYQVELRALDGLVGALEPRPRGPQACPEREIERLEREVARLEKEVGRQQSLARAAQRALGLSAVAKPKRSGKKKRRHRTARALKLVSRLQSAATAEEPEEIRAATDTEA